MKKRNRKQVQLLKTLKSKKILGWKTDDVVSKSLGQDLEKKINSNDNEVKHKNYKPEYQKWETKTKKNAEHL